MAVQGKALAIKKIQLFGDFYSVDAIPYMKNIEQWTNSTHVHYDLSADCCVVRGEGGGDLTRHGGLARQ